MACCALSQTHTLPINTHPCLQVPGSPTQVSALPFCLYSSFPEAVSLLSFHLFLRGTDFLCLILFFSVGGCISPSLSMSLPLFLASLPLSPLSFPCPIVPLPSPFPCESLASHRHRCACRCFIQRDPTCKQREKMG